MTGVDIRTQGREVALMTALAKLRERVSRAAESVGRKPTEIELLPVTKLFPAGDVAILLKLGCRSFGESRDQEAAAKVAAVAAMVPDAAARGIAWHMIGQIQRNKAKSIAAWAHTAHSVSSARVVTALQDAVSRVIADGRRTIPLGVYVQLSLDGDVSRGGIDIDDRAGIDALCDQVVGSSALDLLGVMGIPPLQQDPDAAFKRLADEHRRVIRNHPGATKLSAGMSGDLEIAIKHGSTCVRVGTALMGQRPLTSP
jgi:pyridoxal phosphate enzyme (YggS family)